MRLYLRTQGVAQNPAINMRALWLLFSEVTGTTGSPSAWWIYNETLRNLLGDNPSLNPDSRGQLYVPGLNMITVQSPGDTSRGQLDLHVKCYLPVLFII
ncbi:unnamed protein product [Lota lota]